jgi:hypothetical protein
LKNLKINYSILKKNNINILYINIINMEVNTEKKIDKYTCEKCNYKCNYNSQWIKHCDSELHKTGKRKKRTDAKEISICKNCDYKTQNNTTMLKHVLNKHSTKEERKNKFKHYCELCDFGTFSKDTIEFHKNSEKHKIYIQRQ